MPKRTCASTIVQIGGGCRGRWGRRPAVSGRARPRRGRPNATGRGTPVSRSRGAEERGTRRRIEDEERVKRVVLAMSGGVDSSAAAVILKEAGYDVIGLFMRSGVTEEVCALPTGGTGPALPVVSRKQGCCSAVDAADARRVADRLDIPFHAVNFRDSFRRIQDYFVDEYLAGRTPNPCVACNNWLKFGRLWEFARQVGADFIATGHYARITASASHDSAGCASVEASGDRAAEWALRRGADPAKDQSYVLFGIRRELLPRILFPVGTRTKDEIRALARQSGLRVAEKPDSQEICFIPDNDYVGFIRRHRGRDVDTSGEFVDTSGRVVGRHAGYERYTVGQRKGLGLALGEPYYVVAIEPRTRRVVVGRREELAAMRLGARGVNWLIDPPSGPFRCQAQIRYRHRAADATVEPRAEGAFLVNFDEPQYGVAPGQAVVLYVGDRVVGGGWIEWAE
ncbi:MAG: tRNA 2-thiouridine(34) synthase MnmA [Planctomycetota bacterium]|nr:MAG: tRNA 2-thiouridine(34) synthase MnmA [Planctomycetota bacterium]